MPLARTPRTAASIG